MGEPFSAIAIAEETAKDVTTKVAYPMLKKIWGWCKYNLHPKSVHFGKYKEMMKKRFESINNPVLANAKIKLDDVFLPQTLIIEDSQEEVFIDRFPIGLISTHRNLIIKDTAGRGKSTLMKKMFLWCIEEGRFPVFIDLRNLKKGHLILDEMLKELGEYDEGFDLYLLQKFLDDGYLIIFLDGFDEVSADVCSDVARDINDFVSRADKNLFILTSRDDDRLAGFANFKGARLKDFTIEESYQLIRKYDGNTEKAEEIITLLEGGSLENVKDFLRSPLHTTLFYGAYKQGRAIPIKLHEVCRDIYKALYDLHDFSKNAEFVHNKKCKISESDFERVLGYIGFHCLANNTFEIESNEMCKVLQVVKEQCPDIVFTDEDLLYDISISLSIFRKRRTTYEWIHEMMCHYFAARCVSLENITKIKPLLSKVYHSQCLERYVPMLRIYSELNPVEFRKCFLLTLLKDYQTHYIGCLRQNTGHVSNGSRELRAYLLFGNSIEMSLQDSKLVIITMPQQIKPLIPILYEYHNQIFGTIDFPENAENCKTSVSLNEGDKINLSFKDFSSNQQEYDDCNLLIAMKSGDKYYLLFQLVQEKIKDLEDDKLLYTDKDLIRLDYGI